MFGGWRDRFLPPFRIVTHTVPTTLQSMIYDIACLGLSGASARSRTRTTSGAAAGKSALNLELDEVWRLGGHIRHP